MAGTVDDLEESLKRKEATEPQAEFEGDEGLEELMKDDMRDAVGWLNKCRHLLDYISDKDLCKAISKRERDSMAWLSDQIGEFLDDVETHYNEDEGDEV